MEARALIALFVLSGAAFAQFEKADAEMLSCEKGCCESAGGNWSSGGCNMAVYTSGYNSCEDRCFENATGSIRGSAPGSSFCCAPAAMLGIIISAAFVFRKGGVEP